MSLLNTTRKVLYFAMKGKHMTKTSKEYFDYIAETESSNNYKSENKYGYLGRYQMGEMALDDAGYYKINKQNHSEHFNKWNGKFTGKDGIYSKKDFLNNPQAQENAIRAYYKKNWQSIKNCHLDEYIGKNINGTIITESGLLAGAHLKGVGGLNSYLKSNGKKDIGDAYKTTIKKYSTKFAGYDMTEIIKPNIPTPPNNNKSNLLEGRISKSSTHTTTSRQEGESRIEYFTRRIRESMEKSSQKSNNSNQSQQGTTEETKKHSLKDVLASQKEKLEGIKEKIFNRSMPLKRMHNDVVKDYQNKYLKDKKIFTKEEIQTMSNEDKKKYSQAIKYQNDTIGVPDEKQAEKMSKKEGSGLIKVSGYTRRDGTVVKSYYRSR